MKNNHQISEPPDFSLVLGGPLFQLLMRLKLTTPALALLKKRILFITLFAWLPLLIFSLMDGKAWGGLEVPFLFDFEAQSRFLVALPLLIAAELVVHKRVRIMVGQFIERNIITENVLPKFMELIASAMRLRNSVLFESLLLFFIFVGGHYLWTAFSGMQTIVSSIGSWYATSDSQGIHLSKAGYWYFFISRPLFQFILSRWYFRLFVWARFLWQCSRLKLNLIPTHPDGSGGLGFLAQISGALFLLIAAHGILLSGLIADYIFYAGAKLPDFMLLIIGIVLFLYLIILGPLLVFIVPLLRAKRNGLREYGILASCYVSEFDHKWVSGGAACDEPLLGSSDIQSLADLANSFQVIRNLQPVPFSKETLLQITFIALIPVLPLVLTMIPLDELIRKFIEAIF